MPLHTIFAIESIYMQHQCICAHLSRNSLPLHVTKGNSHGTAAGEKTDSLCETHRMATYVGRLFKSLCEECAHEDIRLGIFNQRIIVNM